MSALTDQLDEIRGSLVAVRDDAMTRDSGALNATEIDALKVCVIRLVNVIEALIDHAVEGGAQ